jgi:hypothetical protein
MGLYVPGVDPYGQATPVDPTMAQPIPSPMPMQPVSINSPVMQPVGIQGGPGGSKPVKSSYSSPAMLDRRRKMAESLMGQGLDISPIASPWQGAARMADALVGTLGMRGADQQEQAGRSAANQELMQAFAENAHPDNSAMMGILGNQWADPSQKQAALDMWRAQNPVYGRNGLKYGMQPFITQGSDGKIHAYQLSTGGGMQEIQMPDGQQYAPKLNIKDYGTYYGGINPNTGQMSPVTSGGEPVPKDLAGAASQRKLGEKTGTAEFDLPRIEQNTQTALATLDRLENSPGMGTMVGPVLGARPEGTVFTGPEADFMANLQQATGQSFLQAYETLKGGGQITEIEGQKATAAISKLQNRRQSPEGYRAAIGELRDILQRGLARAHQQAGVAQPGQPALDPSQAQPIPQPQQPPQSGSNTEYNWTPEKGLH